MLIGLLPTLRKGKEKRTRLLFILGCLWAAAVAVSRIWMGAHFLTDVINGLADRAGHVRTLRASVLL